MRIELVRSDPNDVEARNSLGATLNNIGVLLQRAGRNEEALALYLRSVQHIETAYARAPQVIRYGQFLDTGYHNLALMSQRLGRKEEALRWYTKTLAHRQDRARANPAIPDLQGKVAAGALGARRVPTAVVQPRRRGSVVPYRPCRL